MLARWGGCGLGLFNSPVTRMACALLEVCHLQVQKMHFTFPCSAAGESIQWEQTRADLTAPGLYHFDSDILLVLSGFFFPASPALIFERISLACLC